MVIVVTLAGVADEVTIRRARTPDVPAIKALVDIYAGSGRKMLAKQLVTVYEDVQDFRVAEAGDEIVGCGALHVLWADLGEIRTVAVRPDHLRLGIGGLILEELVGVAEALGLSRLFALTSLRTASSSSTADRSTRTPTTRCAAPTTRASRSSSAWST